MSAGRRRAGGARADFLARLGPGPVGFAGCPPAALLAHLRRAGRELADLDVPGPGFHLAAGDEGLPRTTCAILRTVYAQAAGRPDLAGVVMAAGADKCEGARYVARLLADRLACPVLAVENRARRRRPTPIAASGLALAEKIERITAALRGGRFSDPGPACRPPAAFWGVPPWDSEILGLFPAGTLVLGWTRCLEAGVPGDLDLEMEVVAGLPTVFFAQTFCAKNSLARALARRTGGLHVEADGRATGSTRAKIEAFLALAEVRPGGRRPR